ncbi:MAG: rod shape-determining protein MreC [Synergistaceae bacterium]|jgi:rod shape-determining protein MreC|nr:rod shape-determining protein MreC [Synergistaceae bacterium]
MVDRRLTLEWIHGIVALTLGLFLLGVSPNVRFLRNVVDFVGSVLSVPEHPAVRFREFLQELYLWSRDKSDLTRQLEVLKNENAKLQIANSVIMAEQIKSELDMRMEDARVTLREPHSWWNEVRIDKGLNDGIIMGLPVFQNGFLVGRVSSVSAFSSWVELLTSSALMIPVVIEETRELGVVVGNSNGAVLLTYIPEGRGIEKGMKVSTALIGELLPSGIPIGAIADEGKASSDNGYMTYKIEPGAFMSRLYTVSVLKHSGGIVR